MEIDVEETTTVIICGCGPTGAMLSAQLGRAQVPNICLERESGVTTDPRGIALDEDGIRALQSAGVYDAVYAEIGHTMGVFNFVGGTRKDLTTAPFTRMDYSTTEGGTGHVGFLCHEQPALEKALRTAQAATLHSQLRGDCTIASISEDDDWVYAEYIDGQGNTRRLRGRFLVGADGKTGYTRKKYLEPRGIMMAQASTRHYEEVWVAINLKMTLPTPQTHPDFPLWSLGYTPEQVYDLFFPTNFRFLCNPERAAVCGRFGVVQRRLWRFEYVVKEGEDGEKLCQPESIKQIVYPYLRHPGSRYGLTHDVEYPEDCIQTLRARPFLFSARSCNKWAEGRVILCGDAAHVFPPFGGQGIASGFRDACSLAWYLELVCQPGSTDHASLLKSWYSERKQQLEKSIAATVQNGAYVTERDPIKIFLRDTYLWLVQLVPSWRRQLEKGPRAEGMTRYSYEDGMLFLPNLHGGWQFPQVYCTRVTDVVGDVAKAPIYFTDDVIFDVHKRGLLQLVVIIQHPREMDPSRELSAVDAWSDGHVLASEATHIIQKTAMDLGPSPASQGANSIGRDGVVRLASAEEFAASPLCVGRPEPRYYDPYWIQTAVEGRRYVLLRKDRFVFAACNDLAELKYALQQLQPMLRGEGWQR
ncbi:putative monooxygenase [Teratosphaeria destructans]|uniref:Monooxygenase n=1 Tax=Teratosphaeria destructans TaxID=418781 RepID=A0A9W7W6I8_9PEZI|nr:putative monooxygenase [Teratosphaeria destructans]